MNNTKTTKRALLSSVVAMLVCITMLIGTTFAWFTDTASTAVNKIQAGTLDVQLLDGNGNSLEGKTLAWQKAAGAPADEQVLWEPGCTYKLQPITIKNAGNLALKYKVIISGINGSAKLNEVIDWTISGADIGTEYHLTAGNSSTLTIQGHMKESAGNEYQGLSIDGIGITVVATQDTVEYDSNNNTYDANATYELVKFAFDNPTEEIAFCPVCYGAGTTDNHANHDKYIKIENGVAKVEQTGAWLNFADLDWDNNTYLLEYDVDLSDLATGAFVAFDSGETATWNDLHLGFKRADGGIKAYKTLFTTSLDATTELGVIGDNVHVVYKYSVNAANALDMQMVISDGTNTYTAEKTVNNFNKSANICWDVYTADGTSATFAKLDNLVFSSISK